MKNKIFLYLAALFIIFDIGYSFLQHYNSTLDGDLAECVVPAKHFEETLNNPIGIKAIQKNIKYPNPNRFFSQWSLYQFMNKAPILIQKYTSPIESVYISAGIVKTIIQILLIYCLAVFISGETRLINKQLILAAFLVTPLFQTYGYRSYMGIVDISLTYTFFYAFPTLLLLIYLTPFFLKTYYNKNIKKITFLFLLPLSIAICLSGPLNPGIILVLSLLLFIHQIIKNKNQGTESGKFWNFKTFLNSIPKLYLTFIFPLALISLYSLFLAKYNSHNDLYKSSLLDLYLKLPKGIYNQFTQKLGFPILFAFIFMNVFLIKKKFHSNESKRIFNISKWMFFFFLIYIMLLPLGGYRDYRSNVLRYDSILPITLCLIFIFGKTTLFILDKASQKMKYWYYPIIILVAFIFTMNDKPGFDKNSCEKQALKTIADSKNKIVKLDSDCPVLSWDKISDPEKSELNSKLLKKWNIIDSLKLYSN